MTAGPGGEARELGDAATHAKPLRSWSWRQLPPGQEKDTKLRASTSVKKLASHFLELLHCLLLITIYGINNNSLTDVEGPGEESGCGREGIVSLLGKKKKKKKVDYFPKRAIEIQMSSCSLHPMDWQHVSNMHLADGV